MRVVVNQVHLGIDENGTSYWRNEWNDGSVTYVANAMFSNPDGSISINVVVLESEPLAANKFTGE